jgi:hypothetical protein
MRKIKSVKFWALIFCCTILAFIVFTSKVDFISVATILSAAPISYFAANVAQDFIFQKGNNNDQ